MTLISILIDLLEHLPVALFRDLRPQLSPIPIKWFVGRIFGECAGKLVDKILWPDKHPNVATALQQNPAPVLYAQILEPRLGASFAP